MSSPPRPAPTAQALEQEVAAARAEHRRRLADLAGIGRAVDAPTGEPPTVTGRLRAALGRAFGAPRPRPASIEAQVESAQQRVARIAHALDQLAADRLEAAREIDALVVRIATADRAATAAATDVAALEAELDAAAGDDPDDARLVALQTRITAADADRRGCARAVERLGAIARLHRAHLQAVDALETNLGRLHAEATGALDALDDELADLVTEERARALAEAVSTEIDVLRERIARVNRAAHEGAVLLTERLDRLADEVDLLAPVDPAALAAEEEVAVHLRTRSTADVVARARQQAALRTRRGR